MDLPGGWKEMKVEKIVPTWRWTETSDSHSLHIDVPGFKKDEVSMKRETGIISLHGERQLNSKIIYFEESYKAPNDSNLEEAIYTFMDGVLCINIPKKLASELPTPVFECVVASTPVFEYNEASTPVFEYNEPSVIAQQGREPEEEESDLVKKIAKQVKNNSTEILIAVIAFSLGVLVSHGYMRGKGGKRSE